MRRSEFRAVDPDGQLILRQGADGSIVSADLPGGFGFGWTAVELSELSLIHLIHPEDRVVVERGREWCAASGTDQVVHMRVRAPGGRWQWYEATVRRAAEPAAGSIEMILRDISETTLPQEALTMVIGLRNFIDVAADVDDVLIEAARRIVQFARFDRGYVWRVVDGLASVVGSVGDIAAAPRLFEPTSDSHISAAFDASAARVLDDRHSRDPRAHDESVVSVIAAPLVARGEVLAVFEFESNRGSVGKGVVVMITDVLDQLADAIRRKGVEVELDIAEQQLAVAFNEAPIGMALTTIEGRFIRVNRAACELLEREPEELASLSIADVSHPDDRGLDLRQLDEVLAGGLERFQLERRFIRPDGSTVQTLSSVAVVRDADGVPLHLITQLVDISAQKAREFQVAQRLHPAEPGSPAVVEALDAFLQAQAAFGLPTGIVRVEFTPAHPSAGHPSAGDAIVAAMDEIRRSTRNGDYFAPVTTTVALVAVAAFADDQDRLINVVDSVGERIRAMIDRALVTAGIGDAGPSVGIEVDASVVNSATARASELVTAPGFP